MQSVDLVLKNGKVATSIGILEAGIAVDSGKTVAIAKDCNLPRADVTIDMKGKVAIPGVIDSHVHIFMPERIRETFETGTRAAAVGGVTTVIEMPTLGRWLTTTVKNLRWKRRIGEKQAIVDFALYGGEIQDEGDLIEIANLIKEGVVGFKITMGGGTAVKNDEILVRALQRASQFDSIVSVHAENNQLLNYFRKELISKGRKDIKAHADSRPNIVEAEAISRAILYSEEIGSRLHICHMSTKEGVRLVGEAKSRGTRVTSETCPHFLLFTQSDYAEYGPSIVTNPPLRSKFDLEATWHALAKGIIDIITTDHCAYSKEEKGTGWTDVWNMPAGIPGLETLVCLMLSKGVNEGRISLERFIQLSSEKPAKIFGLHPRKGTIQVGSDADIVIIDLKKEDVISNEKLLCAADYTPYEGWKAKGWPVMTIVRGNVVMEESEIIEKPGFGQFVPSSVKKQVAISS